MFAKIWGWLLMQSRKIKLKYSRSVTLTNFSQNDIAKYEEKITNLLNEELSDHGKSLLPSPEQPQKEVEISNPRPALGTFQDETGDYYLVLYDFDPETKQTKVKEIKNCGRNKFSLSENFKLAAISNGLVF